MKEHLYYRWKKIWGDVLCGLILLFATKIPELVFDRVFAYSGGSFELPLTAEYVLICLSWFAFLAFAASRIPKILSGEYRDE